MLTNRAISPKASPLNNPPLRHPAAHLAVLRQIRPDRACCLVDFAALANNIKILHRALGGSQLHAVLKADGYGLGAVPVGRFLATLPEVAGFFVAHTTEAMALRDVVPTHTIGVLHGVVSRDFREAANQRLSPVLCTANNVQEWSAYAAQQTAPLPAYLHVDTAMNRLGLCPDEVTELAAQQSWAQSLHLQGVISHLASADEPDSPQNAQQLKKFLAAAAQLPVAPRALANSAGVFLGAEYHLDFARTGKALYGNFVTPRQSPFLQPVATLYAPILQLREIRAGDPVGYNATFYADRPLRTACLALGYADGLHRRLSNQGAVYYQGVRCPILGRVSMDLTVIDVSAVPPETLGVGAWVEVFGQQQSLQALADDAGTSGYEMLTSLAERIQRIYLPA